MNEALTGYLDHSDVSDDPVNHLERKELKILLILKKREISLQIDLIEESVRSLTQLIESNSIQNSDSKFLTHELNQRNLEHLRQRLSEITHALQKYSEGTYGYCEGSGEPMSVSSLRKTPWLRYRKEYIATLDRLPKKKFKLFSDESGYGVSQF